MGGALPGGVERLRGWKTLPPGASQTRGDWGYGGTPELRGPPGGKKSSGERSWRGRESLVQPRIRNGPVEVFLGQSLTPEAAVVGHPAAVGKVSLHPHDGSLVCKKFGGIVREAGGQEGCHYGKTLDPNRYILDRRAGGKGRLARCVRQGIVYAYLRHLDILEIEDPLSHPWWQHRRGVVGALRGEGRGGEDQATELGAGHQWR